MKKCTSFLIVAVIALFAASCGGSNTPAGIEKSIYTQMQMGNYDKAVEMLVDHLAGDKEATAEEKAQMVTVLAPKAKQTYEAKGGIKSFEITEEKISEDGESATVSSKIVYGNGEEGTNTSKYVKKDGVWKLSANK